MARKPRTVSWTRRDFIKTVGLIGGVAAVGWPVDAHTSTWISDTAVHAPPKTGPYAYSPPYGLFRPGQVGFPAVGQTYVDPVFGNKIRRLTDAFPLGGSGGDIYGKNGWWNADATYFVAHLANGDMGAIHAVTGAVKTLFDPGAPFRTDVSCSPVDPDVYYYVAGQQLKQQLISTGAVSAVKNFGVTLQGYGGSLDWIDNSGRYMLLNLGNPSLRVWDKQTDTLYTGAITSGFTTGYVAITPTASHVVVVQGASKKSYAINHTTKTLATNGFTFYSGGGDHGDLLCPSDGHHYFLRGNGDNNPSFVERVDIESGIAVPIYTFPPDAYWTAGVDHVSGVSKGPMRDWVVIDSELAGGPTQATDNFDASDPVGSWGKLQNEIYMINILTGELRRLAHHRSREMETYEHQPRVCVSWDGTRVAWASNMGYKSSPLGYSDIWTLDMGTGGPPLPPSGLTVS